jgi:excisionase family DNA binding protein
MRSMLDTTRPYLTPHDMAELTGLPIGVIRRAIANGEMPALRLGRGRGGAMRVRREAFEQWLLWKETAEHVGAKHEEAER